MKKTLSLLDGASLVALVVSMCSQIDVRHFGRDTLAEGLGFASKTFALALSDVVFLLVTLFFVGRVIQLKAWKKLWWPPLPCFALLFALVISMLHSGTVIGSVAEALAAPHHGLKGLIKAFITKESKVALADVVQWSAYFLVAPWIFVNLLHDRRDGFVSRRVVASGAFVFAVMASGIVALMQTQDLSKYGEAVEKFGPSGLFGSANIYGAFLALAIPFIVEMESDNIKAQARYWIMGGVLIFVMFATVVSIWAYFGLAVGLVAAVLTRRGDVKVKAFRLALVTGLAIAALGLWRVPTSLSSYRTESLKIASEHQKVKKQYIEWQAALGWSIPRERAFATGVGPGNYQLNIGPLYNSLPNEEKMPPDSNNLYLVQAVSIGALGLGALLWVLFYFWATAWKAAKKFPTDWLGAGVCAALSSWLFVNLFHALIVRGVGLVLAFLFALAVIALEGERNEETPLEV